MLEQNDQNADALQVAAKLKDLLLQIDFRVEVLPEYSLNRISAVLEEIQGAALTATETTLLEEILREIEA